MKKTAGLSECGPEILTLLAGWIRAGLGFEDIWRLLKEEFPALALAQFDTLPVQKRLTRLFEGEDWILARALFQMGHDSGGSLAEGLEKCAQVMRQKMELRARISMLTAEGNLSGWVVGLSPLFLLGALQFLSPEMIRPLFKSQVGWMVLALAGLLDGTGLWVARRITRVKV